MGRIRVTATIDRIECVQQSEGALVPALDPTSEPYLWAAMFVVDGFQVSVVDPPRFTFHIPDPPLRIQVNQGSHGNLYSSGASFPTTGVDNGDVLEVPPEAGFFRTFVRAMQLPPPCDPLLPHGFHGLAGIAAILLEHDNLDDDDAERGHRAFNAALADVLTEFVEGRSILAGDPAESEIEAMATEIRQRIESEIQAGFEADDVIDAIRGLDHELGHAVWTFPIQDLLAARQPFTATMTDRPGNEWVIAGSAHAIDDCLVNAFNASRTARGEDGLDDGPLREIRARLSPRTAQRVRDALGAAAPATLEMLERSPELEARAVALFERFSGVLTRGDQRVSAALAAEARDLADHMLERVPRAQRSTIERLANLLSLIEDRTMDELIAIAERNPGLFTGGVKVVPR